MILIGVIMVIGYRIQRPLPTRLPHIIPFAEQMSRAIRELAPSALARYLSL